MRQSASSTGSWGRPRADSHLQSRGVAAWAPHSATPRIHLNCPIGLAWTDRLFCESSRKIFSVTLSPPEAAHSLPIVGFGTVFTMINSEDPIASAEIALVFRLSPCVHTMNPMTASSRPSDAHHGIISVFILRAPANHPGRGLLPPSASLSDDARTWTLRQNAASFAYPRG